MKNHLKEESIFTFFLQQQKYSGQKTPPGRQDICLGLDL